jgi:hypothetical protein
MINTQQEIVDEDDESESPSHIIEHLHKKVESDEYAKEIIISGVNKSVYLKTNQREDNLKAMVELGLKTLKELDKGGG